MMCLISHREGGRDKETEETETKRYTMLKYIHKHLYNTETHPRIEKERKRSGG